MEGQLSPQALGWFFAYAPLVIGLIIFFVTYAAKRGETAHAVPIGQTFACAGCGKRAVREHMMPRTQEGVVMWFCPHCAGSH